MFSLQCDGWRGMNGCDLVIFWMDDFKCLLGTAFMGRSLKGQARSGSVWEGSVACLSGTWRFLLVGILFLCLQRAHTHFQPSASAIRHLVMGQKQESKPEGHCGGKTVWTHQRVDFSPVRCFLETCSRWHADEVLFGGSGNVA